MSKSFFIKFAFTNLKKNHQIYIPYMISCVATVAMFFIMSTLANNKQILSTSGGVTLKSLLGFAMYIIGIFSVLLLFYTNSFLMKRRNKELGLYHVLGMEKKHIIRIFFCETFLVAGITIATGMLIGFILEKLMLLILMKIIFFQVSLGEIFSTKAFVTTLILFMGIFAIIFVSHVIQIKKMKPIELLGSEKYGEQEPKSNRIVAIVGLVALAAGYGITFTVKNPTEAILTFFAATLLVIVGTYCIFTSGSIVFLKLLRKKKSYYYKTKNFISLSSMIFRMKQNAWGLASICILSTAVILTISTTVSIYCGVEDILQYRYPNDLEISLKNSTFDTQQTLLTNVKNEEEKNHIQVSKEAYFSKANVIGSIVKDNIVLGKDMHDVSGKNTYAYINMIPLEDYNRLTNKQVVLNDNEVLLYRVPPKNGSVVQKKHLMLDETVYKSVGSCKDFPIIDNSYADYYMTYCMVLKDPSQILDYFNKGKSEVASALTFSYYGKYKNNPRQIDKFLKVVTNQYANNPNTYVTSRQGMKEGFYAVYGTIFFIGIFLGILFLGATTLIIYYKQVSEGFEDRNRYIIMQNIGLSKTQVKRSIRSQILKVFIFPLLMAVLHIIIAFHIMVKLLSLFGLKNITLFIICTAVTIICFCLCYIFVYMATAKTYYQLVHAKK